METDSPSTDGPAELYDLSRDPGETRNLASRHPEVVRKLTGLLASLRRRGHSRP